MRLSEIMTQKVLTAAKDDSLDVARHRMQSARIHHLLVLEGKRVVGVVSDRDMGGPRGRERGKGLRVSDVMSGSVVSASPATTVREAANLLRGRAIGCLPVLSGDQLVGIITVSDLLELIGRGVERPVARTTRWFLKHRGPRPQPRHVATAGG